MLFNIFPSPHSPFFQPSLRKSILPPYKLLFFSTKILRIQFVRFPLLLMFLSLPRNSIVYERIAADQSPGGISNPRYF